MEDISYVSAFPEELPAVKALLDRRELPTKDLRPDQLRDFLLCRSGESLVGTVGLELLGQCALLRSLAVAPHLRGRRLGHELWTRARDQALAHGIRRLYLLTTTAESLSPAGAFTASSGTRSQKPCATQPSTAPCARARRR